MSDLHVVLPGFLGPFSADIPPHIQQAVNDPAYKKLNRWLSRATMKRVAATDIYSTLQMLLCPQCNLTLCELMLEYDAIDTAAGYCYRVDPVHFKAESDHAVLLGSNILKPDENESRALIQAFNQHFSEDNLSLQFADADRWYLQSRKPLLLNLQTIDDCLGRDIKHFMPQGEDALWWRRILNEAQMLFFQHEVNVQRENSQQLGINGLWLWDKTFASFSSDVSLNKAFVDDSFSVALAEYSGISHDSVAAFFEQLNVTDNELVVLKTFYDATCYGDIDAWLEALQSFNTDYFRYLVTALKTRQYTDIYIYPCDGRVFHINRWRLLNIFKPQKNMTQFFAETN